MSFWWNRTVRRTEPEVEQWLKRRIRLGYVMLSRGSPKSQKNNYFFVNVYLVLFIIYRIICFIMIQQIPMQWCWVCIYNLVYNIFDIQPLFRTPLKRHAIDFLFRKRIIFFFFRNIWLNVIISNLPLTKRYVQTFKSPNSRRNRIGKDYRLVMYMQFVTRLYSVDHKLINGVVMRVDVFIKNVPFSNLCWKVTVSIWKSNCIRVRDTTGRGESLKMVLKQLLKQFN